MKIFGSLKYQNDKFWELMTELVLLNFTRVASEQLKLDILRGYAASKRGSDEFWKYTIEHLMEECSPNNTLFHEPLLRDITLAAIGLKLSLPTTLMDYSGLSPASIHARMDHLYGRLPSTTCEDLAYLLLNHPDCTKKHADLFEENIGQHWGFVDSGSRLAILQMYEQKGRPQYFEQADKGFQESEVPMADRLALERIEYEESLGEKSELPVSKEGSRDTNNWKQGGGGSSGAARGGGGSGSSSAAGAGGRQGRQTAVTQK